MAITDDKYLLSDLQQYPRNRSLFYIELRHLLDVAWEERFDKLSAQNSFATTTSAGQTCVLQARTLEQSSIPHGNFYLNLSLSGSSDWHLRSLCRRLVTSFLIMIVMQPLRFGYRL